jgi:hypothetical protein
MKPAPVQADDREWRHRSAVSVLRTLCEHRAATPDKNPAISANPQLHAETALHRGKKSGKRGALEDQ